MPCRDAARHLPEAIASIRSQSFEDYEVLAVDDASTDSTGSLLAEWSGTDRRVRVVPARGEGLIAALASSAAAARGELIARMDADDIAGPDRLAEQVRLMDADPRMAACGTGVQYFPADQVRDGARRYQRWINGLSKPEEIERDIFVECPIAHPTLMIRRNVLAGVGGYRDLGWPEDYDLVLRLWAAGYRLANVPAVLHRWRERPDRVSRTDRRYAFEAFLRLKVHFLARTLLADGRAVVVWGAGRIGKALAVELREAGVTLEAFVDVDPRKVGQQIHDVPVIMPDQLDHFSHAMVLAAVGVEGTREQIRTFCRDQGLVEGLHFVAVA